MHDFSAVTAETIAAACDAAIAAADALIERAAASADDPTFASTLGTVELAGAAIAHGYGRSAFLGYVHPNQAARDAGHAAEERITKWRVGLPFREDLYRAVSAFAATDAAAELSGEERRLLDHWMRDFRRAGQELEPSDRAELERLRGRLVELEVAFQGNLNESPRLDRGRSRGPGRAAGQLCGAPQAR